MNESYSAIKYEVRPQAGNISVDIYGTVNQITGIDLQPAESSPSGVAKDSIPSFYSNLAEILLDYLDNDVPFDNAAVFHQFPFSEGRMTHFQRQCYAVILHVPFGYTITYGAVAWAVGNPQASRAVGGAMRANPFPLVIPCHRVVGETGLGGFMGSRANLTLDVKQELLSLESMEIGT
jgi:O-6-methylguanine DNA methyltransferase